MKFAWNTLPRPFSVLAPLDGVTDMVFRQMITEIGKPDVLFTEFTPCEGLQSAGRERVLPNLRFTPEQQPVIAQIWGTRPEQYLQTAKELVEMGFAGIDINMGCPHRTITNVGACSALIKNPSLAKEIIHATQEGAGELPVSVKTRIGFSHEIIDEWIGMLLEQKLSALTVHLRTTKEESKVPAHWEKMPQIKAMRDQIAPETTLIGNGDILSLDEMKAKHAEYGIDGFMVGRGIFANPWLFNPKIVMEEMSVKTRLELYHKHISLYKETWGTERNFASLKKFAKTYISNFTDASEIREELMQSRVIDELLATLEKYLQKYQ